MQSRLEHGKQASVAMVQWRRGLIGRACVRTIKRVLFDPDDDRACEEEILELVGVAVGAHIEQVLVLAELLKREAATLDEHAAIGHIRLVDRKT